jgi:hypothetical protein
MTRIPKIEKVDALAAANGHGNGKVQPAQIPVFVFGFVGTGIVLSPGYCTGFVSSFKNDKY